MTTRSSTTICLEGWYYLFIVLFVIGGAVLGEVNLLVVLGGMMIGPLIFNWRFVKLMVRDLRVHRRLPDRVCSGDVVPIGILAHNDRSRLATWTLVMEERLSRRGAEPHADAAAVRVMVPRVAAGQTATVEYRLQLSRRGRYEFQPLRWSTRFPLGLIRATCTEQQTDALLVCPRLGKLTQRWLGMVNARQTGSQSNAHQRGSLEGDYYGLREWRTGDSQRWIHWRTSARLGELAVRQFEQQRNRNMVMVLDLWQPDRPTVDERVCVETAISFLATAVSQLCGRGGGKLTVSIAGSQVQHWASAASALLAREILDYLAEIGPGDGLAIYDVLQQARSQRRPGTPTVVISTRSAPFLTGDREPDDAIQRGDRSLRDVTWIDCRSDRLSDFFRLDGEPVAASDNREGPKTAATSTRSTRSEPVPDSAR